MNKQLLSVLFIFLMMVCSCVEEPIVKEIVEDLPQKEQTPLTRSTVITEYETLANPYALDVMQEVYDTYSDSGEILEPTDLYVKFMPKDSSELHVLKYDYDLELFDYPLDIILEDGDVYVDPDIPETDLSWVYTTVSPDFVFPIGIAYEILEECYIPEDGETVGIATKVGSEIDVEEAAFASLGYDFTTLTTRALASPSGTIKVQDETGSYIPVKGVKVRCHNFVKWSTAYTNESGVYSIPKNFRTNVHYALIFDNTKGFDIWGNWGPIARANHNMGWHSSSGYSENISTSSNAWEWSVVNNSAYDYYNVCETNNILKPPTELKIWVFKEAESSSAPMLRRVNHAIGLNTNSAWLNFFANIGYGSLATYLNQMLKFVLPDITIGTQGSTYNDIYETVCHELAHASHFSKVGSAYWARYISYIMTYGSYGDGTGNNAELCGVGEMWGYFMGCALEHEKFNGTISASDNFPYNPIDGWIHPEILWDIYKKSYLTKKQIYECLTSDVDTYDELAASLYNKNPSKASNIKEVFIDNGITPNASIPWPDDITYDTNIVDRTYNSTSSTTGGHVRLQNVTVNSGAKLTVRGMYSVTIEKPFVANKGCEVEIYYSY